MFLQNQRKNIIFAETTPKASDELKKILDNTEVNLNATNLDQTPKIAEEFGDEIEAYMISRRIQGEKKMITNKSSKNNNNNEKSKYAESTAKRLEHDRQLQILEGHATEGTIPTGLKIHVRSTVSLPEKLRETWNATTHSCSEKLLKILTTYHQDMLTHYKAQCNDLKAHISSSELKSINKNVIDRHNANLTSRQTRKRKNNHNKMSEENDPKKVFLKPPFKTRSNQPQDTHLHGSKNHQARRLKPNR